MVDEVLKQIVYYKYVAIDQFRNIKAYNSTTAYVRKMLTSYWIKLLCGVSLSTFRLFWYLLILQIDPYFWILPYS
jgi:hypothetical protein